jgi:hypothetical protein
MSSPTSPDISAPRANRRGGIGRCRVKRRYLRKAPVIEYQISSYCNGGGCVEVGRTHDGPVVVRDSKDPERRASLVFTAEEWSAFVSGVKNGEFDLA